MLPVAVSVPADAEIEVEMVARNWAFGEVPGRARPAR